MNEDTPAADREVESGEQLTAVQDRYQQEACCGDDASGGGGHDLDAGNPPELAELEPGEDVLDLGCGAGFDCLLAAQDIGEGGNVIGIDMTPGMVTQARQNAARNEERGVNFCLAEMQRLPLADASVDVVLSNCAINLSPDKRRVFEEAHRVLRPGGRIAVADNVRRQELPADLRADLDAIASCVADAPSTAELERTMTAVGFQPPTVTLRDDRESSERNDAVDWPVTDYVVSSDITAVKPR